MSPFFVSAKNVLIANAISARYFHCLQKRSHAILLFYRKVLLNYV